MLKTMFAVSLITLLLCAGLQLRAQQVTPCSCGLEACLGAGGEWESCKAGWDACMCATYPGTEYCDKSDDPGSEP